MEDKINANSNSNVIVESDMDIANINAEISEVLSPEAVEVREALKPTDVILDWNGVFWPLIKKQQYNYIHDPNNSNCIEFTIDSEDAPRNKIPKEYYERLKQIYISAGWEKCIVDLNSGTSTIYIRLYRKI